MSQPALNKSALSIEKKKRSSYKKYLPSLELKQKQLMSERKKHELALTEHRQHIKEIENDVYRRLPMLGVNNIKIKGLVEVAELKIGEQNLLGTKLPTLLHVSYKTAHYSYLSRPHWVDEVATALEKVIKLRLEENILEERLARLRDAVRTITQRVNLFSKVLLPKSQENIDRISLFLADQDRAAVVRSKLAKSKHQTSSNHEYAS